MASKKAIKDAINRLLGLPASGRILMLNSNTCERAYEAYVWALCAKAVVDCGGTAIKTGVRSGPNPPRVVLRGSPGLMSSSAQDFCYIDCSLGTKTFEIHADVTYEGQSGANHEVDVSICQKEHAEDVRQSGRMPRMTKNLIAAIECKFYRSPLGVGLARTFVGLLRDCSHNRLHAFVSNRTGPGLNNYLSPKWAPTPFTDLTPIRPSAEARFISFVAQMLLQWKDSK